MSDRVCRVIDLGRMGHADAERLQEQMVELRRAGEAADMLLLVEHDPVVTIGAAVDDPASEVSVQLLESAGAEVRQVRRGGRATFHGPGQIVGYPILDLRQHRRDLHWYLRALEQVIIDALGDSGIEAARVDGLTGVWVGERKVASIGIAVRGWVTWHGFALNLDVDPRWWRLIDPCGLRPEQMGSLSEISRNAPDWGSLSASLARHVGDVLDLEIHHTAATELFAEFPF